ncbi:ATP-binding protein [Azoarcus sp. DD4]|uniref:AAA family ATPase n=1 Tax=Azoarcus sp. DD4 TaxID=2027405 RepID=UPI00143CF6B2|nr:ATP-binding protein [Azoarcus sp. DD4]
MTTPTIHIVFGTQGAGKTTYSRKLASEVGATRFSIDDWMGELFGPDVPKPMSLPWIMERVQRCEHRIWSIASEIVECGGSAVLDLGFMKVSDRARFISLAETKALPVQMHYVDAPHSLRRARVLSRNSEKGGTFSFEVTPSMFDFMETQFESPTEAELSKSVAIDTQ